MQQTCGHRLGGHNGEEDVEKDLHNVHVQDPLLRGHKTEVDEMHERPHAPIAVQGGEEVGGYLAGDLINSALAAPEEFESEEARYQDGRPQELVCGGFSHHRGCPERAVGEDVLIERTVPPAGGRAIEDEAERRKASSALGVELLAILCQGLCHNVSDPEPKHAGCALDGKGVGPQGALVTPPHHRGRILDAFNHRDMVGPGRRLNRPPRPPARAGGGKHRWGLAQEKAPPRCTARSPRCSTT
mmetsp:Transcript_18855/g.60556  ORF Transcript_18855/g.60556 Transcript_18855/m.60556 type:complete len:243 (-) Transcript_18855:48-776(-)